MYNYLKGEQMEVLFPVIRRIDTGYAIRGVQTHTKGGIKRPTTNVNLAATFIRKNNASRAEHISFDMHLAPSFIEVRCQTQIEFVRASRVRESGW
jgi:hypothetical protein